MRIPRLLELFTIGCLLFSHSAVGSTASGSTAHAPAGRPNVLLILADDMGYADLNLDDIKERAPTPHLNELARRGTRFNRFYTESSCTPSRVALLTGLYPARLKYQPNGLGIPGEVTTLAEAFRAEGYRTHQIGKWHMGHLVPDAWPGAQGFDTWLGSLNPWLMNDPDRQRGFVYGDITHVDTYLQNERGQVRQFPGHLTDVSTDEAIRLIADGANGPPWLIYLAYSAPHEPIQARSDYAAKFPASPAGRYAAMLAHLDDRIGDLIQTLDATGQRDNTIVVFTSDNGGTNAYLNNNAPFAGHKMQYNEGGIRAPLLIEWPGRLPAARTTDHIASIMDVYPTLATLANLPAPTALDGRALLNRDGSIAEQPARPLFWEINSNQAASYSVLSADGRWRFYQRWFDNPTLFDLKGDPASKTDIAASNPAKVLELRAEYAKWKQAVSLVGATFEPQGKQGHGILSGADLQRSVALGNFTIAIGVTPARPAATHPETILEQLPTLDIEHDASGLRVQLHGLSARLPPLPEKRCSGLVITGSINRQMQVLQPPPSTLDIYVDGKKMASLEQRLGNLDATALHLPTYVGHSQDGSRRFEGRLSRPVYLNTRVGENTPVGMSVGALTGQVCSRTNALSAQ